MRIAICDDDSLHLDYTVSLVRSLTADLQPDFQTFSGGPALLQAVDGGYGPDIAILDIRMEELDGIGLAKALNRLLPRCQIIFLTSYLTYATEVYETAHLYFVLKSDAESRLAAALDKALRTLRALEPSDVVCVLQNGGCTVLPVEDIRYLERLGHKTRVATDHGDLWDARKPETLLQDAAAHFVRCHQSYWVSLRRIKALNNGVFTLDGGLEIPVSRPYRTAARDALLAAVKP